MKIVEQTELNNYCFLHYLPNDLIYIKSHKKKIFFWNLIVQIVFQNMPGWQEAEKTFHCVQMICEWCKNGIVFFNWMHKFQSFLNNVYWKFHSFIHSRISIWIERKAIWMEEIWANNVTSKEMCNFHFICHMSRLFMV